MKSLETDINVKRHVVLDNVKRLPKWLALLIKLFTHIEIVLIL